MLEAACKSGQCWYHWAAQTVLHQAANRELNMIQVSETASEVRKSHPWSQKPKLKTSVLPTRRSTSIFICEKSTRKAAAIVKLHSATFDCLDISAFLAQSLKNLLRFATIWRLIFQRGKSPGASLIRKILHHFPHDSRPSVEKTDASKKESFTFSKNSSNQLHHQVYL